jgi:hypothetical protein
MNKIDLSCILLGQRSPVNDIRPTVFISAITHQKHSSNITPIKTTENSTPDTMYKDTMVMMYIVQYLIQKIIYFLNINSYPK